jgi:hypothetical protein
VTLAPLNETPARVRDTTAGASLKSLFATVHNCKSGKLRAPKSGKLRAPKSGKLRAPKSGKLRAPKSKV